MASPRPRRRAPCPRRPADGRGRAAGALLNSVPEGDDAAEFDFLGSTLVCVAESKEAVLEQLRNDVYTTSGVWDTEKVAPAAAAAMPSQACSRLTRSAFPGPNLPLQVRLSKRLARRPAARHARARRAPSGPANDSQ